MVVHLGKCPGNLSIIGTRVEINDFEALFDELDGGDEGLPLDTIDVKFVRMPAVYINITSQLARSWTYLEVMIQTTPKPISLSNNPLRIIAVTISVT